MARPPATGRAFRAGARCRAIPATATSRTCSPRRATSSSPSPRTASTARTACSRTAVRPRARELVRHHLAQWAEWSAHGGDPWGGRFQGRVDLDEVVLVGHSRGGEGVERATIDSYAGRSLAGAGPRPDRADRFRPPGRTRRAHDGDPAVLRRRRVGPAGPAVRGRRPRPHARPRIAVLGHGDGHEPQLLQHRVDAGPVEVACLGRLVQLRAIRSAGRTGTARLTPAEQQAVGLAYTAALVDLAVADDTRSLPLLDGTRVKPRSIGRASAFVHAIGGNKRVLYAAGRGTPVGTTALSARRVPRLLTWPGPSMSEPAARRSFTSS